MICMDGPSKFVSFQLNINKDTSAHLWREAAREMRLENTERKDEVGGSINISLLVFVLIDSPLVITVGEMGIR
jgi:hypothetical protein